MRQISRGSDRRLDRCSPGGLVPHGRAAPSEPSTGPRDRRRAPGPDAGQRRRSTSRPLTQAFPRLPCASPRTCDHDLAAGRRRRGEQEDLRPPPHAVAVPLRLVCDHASGLKVVEPPLHAAAMRADERRAPSRLPRDCAPADHWRQPHDELTDRRRVPSRAGGVPQPEQVTLDRVRARLEAIVPRGRAAAFPPGTAEQRHDDEPPGLRWQRLGCWPVPATRRRE